MTRTRLPLPDLEGYEPEWLDLRDACYRFTMLAFDRVEISYGLTPGDGTRLTELWRPLETVLAVVEVDQTEVKSIRDFYLSQNQETRHEPTTWEVTLLEVLKEKAEAQAKPFEMSSQEILEAMNIEGEVKPGAPWLGNALATYNLYVSWKRKWENGRYLRNYTFQPELVKNLCEIYLGTPPRNPGSSGSNQNNNENTVTCNKPTPNHEPVDPGFVGQNEPILTGSPKSPGSIQAFDNTNESGNEPGEPAFQGGMEEKKRTHEELSEDTQARVRCRDCSQAEVGEGFVLCQGTPWNGIPGQAPDKLHPCQDFIPIKEGAKPMTGGTL